MWKWSACAAVIAACSSGKDPAPAPAPAPVAVAPRPAKPAGEPPAAKLMSGWFAAFDADTAAPLTAFYAAHWTQLVPPIDYASGFRTGTGGFEIKKIDNPRPTRAVATVKEKSSDQYAVATLDIDAGDPDHVIGFNIEAIDTPSEYLTDAERAARTVDDARRTAILAGVAKELRAHYVDPAKAEAMIQALDAHVAAGDYAKVTSARDLADKLTRDLRAVSHDLHLGVMFGRARGPAPAAGSGAGSGSAAPDARPSAEDRLADAQRVHFGFGAIEMLDPHIARVVIDSFPDVADIAAARDAVSALLAPAAAADALVLDLRNNHGGTPDMVLFDEAFLFDAPVHVDDLYSRDTGKTTSLVTSARFPGKRFGGKKPLYVLTSAHTFSGGEQLAYDLQSQHRGKLVGETTGGGAHPTDVHRLDDWFAIAVPFARPINTVTKADWEGTGVVPDVKSTADGALVEARSRAAADLGAAAAKR